MAQYDSLPLGFLQGTSGDYRRLARRWTDLGPFRAAPKAMVFAHGRPYQAAECWRGVRAGDVWGEKFATFAEALAYALSPRER